MSPYSVISDICRHRLCWDTKWGDRHTYGLSEVLHICYMELIIKLSSGRQHWTGLCRRPRGLGVFHLSHGRNCDLRLSTRGTTDPHEAPVVQCSLTDCRLRPRSGSRLRSLALPGGLTWGSRAVTEPSATAMTEISATVKEVCAVRLPLLWAWQHASPSSPVWDIWLSLNYKLSDQYSATTALAKLSIDLFHQLRHWLALATVPNIIVINQTLGGERGGGGEIPNGWGWWCFVILKLGPVTHLIQALRTEVILICFQYNPVFSLLVTLSTHIPADG